MANPSGKLNLTIEDCGVFAGSTAPSCTDGDEVTKYSGTIADMGTPGHAVASLGTFAGGVKHRYHFSLQLDSGTGDAYQNATSSVRFDWNASEPPRPPPGTAGTMGRRPPALRDRLGIDDGDLRPRVARPR